MYAIKRELKLNNKQQTYFAQCAGYSRFVYNYGLALVKESWGFEGVKVSDAKRLDAIRKVFTNVTKKSDDFAWCNAYSSRIYQNTFRDLKAAFSRWRKPELKAEMPRFKRKRHECSFTVDSSSGLITVTQGKSIKIPTLGTYRLKEAIPYTCSSQTFTISRVTGKWYVSFMVKACPLPEMKHSRQVVGVDLGIKSYATLSDGTTAISPIAIKKAKTKLAKKQWRNRNKVIGNRRAGIEKSYSAERYFQQLRKLHRHIANVREDFLQKTTTSWAKKYQQIQIEDLNVKGMLANHKLASALADVGLYRTRELLNYKQKFYGFQLVIVDRWFPSSKTCSVCGHVQAMPLKLRTYECGGCGSVLDRDLNASVNLERWPSLPMAIGIRTGVDLKGPTPKVEASIKQQALSRFA